MLDPVRRRHAIDALQDALCTYHDQPEAAEASSHDLLRRMGISFEDLLFRKTNPDDPLLARQADDMARIVFICRERADPSWLAAAAVWHRVAPHDPETFEKLRLMTSCVYQREEASLEALGVQIGVDAQRQAREQLSAIEEAVGPTLLTSVLTASAVECGGISYLLQETT